MRTRQLGRVALYGLHAVIIINFAVQMAYAGWMVFFGVVPGMSGPLGARAAEISFELMVTRRLYAVEFWIACVGLCVYLAITEIGPRFWRSSHKSAVEQQQGKPGAP